MTVQPCCGHTNTVFPRMQNRGTITGGKNMVQAVVGANWGDEGKGKIVDVLANKADIVVRYQGGANAGHTIVNKYGKFALHTLPSGVCHPEITNVLGNGVALNIPLVVKEIEDITSKGVPTPKLLISVRSW